jgi:hypothetical protein
MCALELGPAKVGEERLLARGQFVGFLAQRAQPLLDAHLLGGGRLHAGGVVRGHQYRRDDHCYEPKRPGKGH